MVKDVTNSALTTIDATIPQWKYSDENVVLLTDDQKLLYEEQVKKEAEPYQNYIVTIETYKSDQKILAALNNKDKAVNAARLQLERSYMKPITDIKNWLKVANKPMDKARTNLDKQIKEFKQRDKELKLSTVKSVFEQLADVSELNIQLFDNYYKDFLKETDFKSNSYELKPVTIKKINDIFDKVQAEENIKKENIELIKESAADAELISTSYITLFERGAGLADVLKQIKEDAKAVELEKKAIEERRLAQEKAEAERKAEIERLAAENANANIKAYDADTGEILEDGTFSHEPSETIAEVPNFEPGEPVTEILKITSHIGQSQIDALHEYLEDNFMNYEKLGE
ncbi:DUF1351 domain-containing protein [Streptococcus agalactiae]|uniref:DUF1351 domain-containing protein n=1 Tax=Streptococcus agalactiae TaxID=1311 RepID=UPI0024BAAFAA|nr:DUF1351 domain-containing protein [Streptococcus agalactiae]